MAKNMETNILGSIRVIKHNEGTKPSRYQVVSSSLL